MSLGEFDIIARYFATQPARGDVLLGIGDDAAVLQTRADRRLAVAMDTIVEGVHFPIGTDAADIGYRAVAVNLSDLAAMGAVPEWMTLSLSLPAANEAWLDGFAQGLFEAAGEHGVALVGGDTVKGPLVITVQIAGTVEPQAWLTRGGARPGDRIFISGVPGEAAAGLAVILGQMPLDESARYLKQRFLRPQPRVSLGRHLRHLASAAMDVSDGLLTDLGKLCAASGCAAQLDIDLLPQSAAMRQLFLADNCVDYALSGGDDYEILFTVPPDRAHEVASLPATLPVCTQIGVIVSGSSVECRRGNQPYTVHRLGFDHFATDVRA